MMSLCRCLPILTLSAVCAGACSTNSDLYCDEDTPCTDSDRPYCDLYGDYPASEGHGKTCIPDPFADAGVDAAVADAATADASLSDAGLASLTISLVGNGSVISNPIGINCGGGSSDCAADFAHGTAITLSASPDVDSDFAGWTSGAPASCAGTDDCSFVIAGDESFAASFDLREYMLTVTTDGDGTGESPLHLQPEASTVARIAPRLTPTAQWLRSRQRRPAPRPSAAGREPVRASTPAPARSLWMAPRASAQPSTSTSSRCQCR